MRESAATGMRSVAKHTAIYGVGIIVTRLASVAMLPVYTRYLSPEDYGVMALLDMMLDVLSIVAGGQLVSGVYRYYFKAKGGRERRRLVSTSFIALMLTYAIMTVIGVALSPALSRVVFGDGTYAGLIAIASVTLVAQCLHLVPLAFARIKDRSGVYLTVTVLRVVLTVSMNVWFLVVLGLGVKGLFISGIIAHVVTGIPLAFWLLRQVGVGWSLPQLNQLVRFGVPMMGVQIGTFVVAFADRGFLQAQGDTAGVGVYNLAHQFGYLLSGLAVVPFMQVWGAKRFEVATDTRPRRDEMLSEGFLFMNVGLCLLAVAICIFVDDFFRIMTTPAFYAAALYVPPILLAMILQSWAGIQDLGILVSEKTEYLTVATWSAGILSVVMLGLLVPRYSVEGALVALLVSSFVRWAITYRFAQKLWPVRYHWSPIMKMLVLGLLFVAVVQLLPTMPLVSSIPVRSALLLAFMFSVWQAGVLDRMQKERLIRMVGDIGSRMRA